MKLNPFMALSYFICFQRSQSLHGRKTRFNLWTSETHYNCILVAWRNKRVFKGVGTLLQCHTFEYERNPQKFQHISHTLFYHKKALSHFYSLRKTLCLNFILTLTQDFSGGFPKARTHLEESKKQNIFLLLYYLIVIIYVTQYLSVILSRR